MAELWVGMWDGLKAVNLVWQRVPSLVSMMVQNWVVMWVDLTDINGDTMSVD